MGDRFDGTVNVRHEHPVGLEKRFERSVKWLLLGSAHYAIVREALNKRPIRLVLFYYGV